MSEAPFQTNTHLSLKKKNKKRNTILYKSKQPFIHGTKEPKKKKRSKNPSDNTRLSIKKKKKNRKKRNTILKKTAIHSGNKRNPKKKKKKGSKNPKTQNVLPDQNSHSLSLDTLLCSFKHIDRPWVVTKNHKTQIGFIDQNSGHRFSAIPSNTEIGDQTYSWSFFVPSNTPIGL